MSATRLNRKQSRRWDIALMAALAVAASGIAPTAQARPKYISLGVGLSDANQAEISFCLRDVLACSIAKTEAAPIATLAGGILFGHFSAELEYTHRRVVQRAVHPLILPHSLQMNQLFVNGYFHFPIGPRLRPFVGLGVGMGKFRADHVLSSAVGGSFGDTFHDDTVVGYQGMFGIDLLLSRNSMVGIGLRFNAFDDVGASGQLRAVDGTGGGTVFLQSSNLDFYNFTLDYTYRFNSVGTLFPPQDRNRNKWLGRPGSSERDRFGFYLQTAIGYLYAHDSLAANQSVGSSADGLSFKSLGGGVSTGIGFGVHAGPLRLEASYDIRQQSNQRPASHLGCASCGTALGDYTIHEYMALAYLDFKPFLLWSAPLVPYVGAGIGIAHIDSSFLTRYAMDMPSASGDDSDAQTTLRFAAGTTYPIDEHINMALEGRLSWYDKTTLSGGGASLSFDEQLYYGLAIVLRYQF